jgi:hypothetical protein
MVFLSVQCCRYGVLYEYSSKKNIKKKIIMSEMSILCFPTSFCLFGSLVIGFLVVFVLVLLSEGILVSCFLVGHSYCQLILLLLYTCRSYIFYFNK